MRVAIDMACKDTAFLYVNSNDHGIVAFVKSRVCIHCLQTDQILTLRAFEDSKTDQQDDEENEHPLLGQVTELCQSCGTVQIKSVHDVVIVHPNGDLDIVPKNEYIKKMDAIVFEVNASKLVSIRRQMLENGYPQYVIDALTDIENPKIDKES